MPAAPTLAADGLATAWMAAPWFVGTILLLGAALYVHRRHWGGMPEDWPTGQRKNHAAPTPLVGILLGVPVLLAVAATGRWILLLAVAVAYGVGAVDDVLKDPRYAKRRDDIEDLQEEEAQFEGLRARTKAVLMVMAVTLGCADAFAQSSGPDFGIVGMLQWLLWGGLLFIALNGLNFLDNTDGVTAVLLVVGAGVLIVQHVPALEPSPFETVSGAWITRTAMLWALAGTAAGFLVFNWPKPMFFLGDGGALGLGMLLATESVRSGAQSGSVNLACVAVALAPIAVPVLDFTQVFAVRLSLRIAPWIADRRHLTHWFIARGIPRVLIAPWFACLAALLAWALLRATN